VITYMYRTNTHYAGVHNKDEALCALDVLEASGDEEGFRGERACIQVDDSGKHHDGLRLTVQAYVEDCEAVDKWRGKIAGNKSYLDVCSLYISPLQARELIEALQNALSMRKYDDEDDDNRG
jgi:hypothetical protein